LEERIVEKSHVYNVPKELPFPVFFFLSLAVLFGAAEVVSRITPKEEIIKTVSVELASIEGLPDEPPPLGEPDALPQDQLVQTPPVEEVIPEPPKPEPIPEPEIAPVPPPVAEFVEPEPPKPEPPKPVELKKAEPVKPKVEKVASVAKAPAAPPIGSPSGVVGGRGGSHGDFLATPHPSYDAVAQQRGYQGQGEVLITYDNGSILSVQMLQSTGVPYRDNRTTYWVKTKYRVKAGVSGKAKFNITWALPR